MLDKINTCLPAHLFLWLSDWLAWLLSDLQEPPNTTNINWMHDRQAIIAIDHRSIDPWTEDRDRTHHGAKERSIVSLNCLKPILFMGFTRIISSSSRRFDESTAVVVAMTWHYTSSASPASDACLPWDMPFIITHNFTPTIYLPLILMTNCLSVRNILLSIYPLAWLWNAHPSHQQERRGREKHR